VKSPNICQDCTVRDLALCGSLDDMELGLLNSIAERRMYARGTTIIWAGGESVICANVLTGMLKLTTSTPDGREQIVGLLYPADFVGQPYSEEAGHSVQALSDVELCVFPRQKFEQVLDNHIRMERLLLQRTLTALQEARARMLMLARKSAHEKVAEFLLEMADKAGPTGCRSAPDAPLTFDLPLTRGQMADILGLTIETVSRQLTQLRTAGVIGLPGSRAVTISNRTALEAIAAAA